MKYRLILEKKGIFCQKWGVNGQSEWSKKEAENLRRILHYGSIWDDFTIVIVPA